MLGTPWVCQAVSWHQGHKDEQKVSQPKELIVQIRLQMDGPFAPRFGPQMCLLWPPWFKNWKLSITVGFLASFEKSEGLMTMVGLPAASGLSGCSPRALPVVHLCPFPAPALPKALGLVLRSYFSAWPRRHSG